MGPGVALAVLGAILTFAVRVDVPGIRLPVVGVILMVAGGAMILNARKGARRQRVITRVQQPGGVNRPTQTIQETIEDRTDLP